MTSYNSEDYDNYRIQRAKETIREVELLIENDFWNAAINRMYYACFYAVSACLSKMELKPQVILEQDKNLDNYLLKLD